MGTYELSDDDIELVIDALRDYEDEEPFADELFDETRGEYADTLAGTLESTS